MKIVAIAGSLRKDSFNMQLAKFAQDIMTERYPDVEFNILDWSDIPFFNQDIEYPTPENVCRVREEIKSADGVWFFSPEYNHYFPGTVKNLIDWLSRPETPTGSHVLIDKPFALSGASLGMSGTSHSQDHLVTLLSYLQARIMNYPRLTIPHVRDQSQEGQLVQDKWISHLERQADAFMSFVD